MPPILLVVFESFGSSFWLIGTVFGVMYLLIGNDWSHSSFRHVSNRVTGGGKDTWEDPAIGKVQIRLSRLQTNQLYISNYPLMVVMGTGVKKMGEVELSVRFWCASPVRVMQVSSPRFRLCTISFPWMWVTWRTSEWRPRMSLGQGWLGLTLPYDKKWCNSCLITKWTAGILGG